MSEKQTCPRRLGELGPWSREENQDEWVIGRWSLAREELREIQKGSTWPDLRMLSEDQEP
jgi:hypothetical protein